jgi:activator of HSP90 ATPase
MPFDSFEVSTVLPAKAQRIYEAWLDGARHAAFTGAAASGKPTVGARFTAWEGYIEGINVELEPYSRIVQHWRTSEFPTGAPDSLLVVQLEPEGDDSTRITLRHTHVPEGQGESYRQGWIDHYFEPLRRHFGEG